MTIIDWITIGFLGLALIGCIWIIIILINL